MKILLTGATGYVGHQLALTLAERGNEVNVIVRDSRAVTVPIHNNIRVYKGDITDRKTIASAITGCEQVYHTAALVKIFSKERSEFFKVNVDGTNNLLAESLEKGVKKFVFTSTCGVLGTSVLEPKDEDDPRTTGFENDYEFTKFLAENLVKEYSQKGLFTVIVSLSKVFGPGIETHPISVNKVIKKFVNGSTTFIPRPGTLVSNYCFIEDVVEGHILAMEKGIGGEKYILGGENISYVDFFQMIRSISGTKALLIEAPKLLVHVWALSQWLQYKINGKEPFVTGKAIKTIFCNKSFNSGKATRQLGYRLTPISKGLQQTIQFFKTQRHAY